MALLTLEDLTTELTPDEVKASIYAALAAMGTHTTTWKPGAVARTIIAIVSIILASFTTLMALIAKSGFLELAEDNWLTLVAYHVFGVTRIQATFAAGTATISNAGGGVYDFDPGDLIVRNTASGKTYANTALFHLGAGQLGLDFAIEALEAGAASTSAPGAIDALETTLIGVTVTNANSVVGLDDELDPPLRLRCLESRSALSPNGPRDAYSYFAKGAKRASDGSLVGVTRVKVSRSSSTATVAVTVANPSGSISGSASDPATDLGAVNMAIQQNVTPDGVTALVASASPVSIAVTYEIWIYAAANLSDAQVQALVADKLTSFMTTQPIGGNVIDADPGKVFVDAIRTAVGAARSEVFHVVVTVPAADVVVGTIGVPLLGTVTCTAVHQEAA